MRQGFKIGLFVMFFAVLWVPIIQQRFKLFKESELKGAYIKPERPHFSLDSVKTLAFQKQVEDYENFDFGFRPFFVKMKNSINYLLFHELSISDNIAGKDDFIFSLGSTKRTLGIAYNGSEKNNATLDKIEFLKNGVEKHGGHFLVLIAPSKESVIPEYLPRPYLNSPPKTQTDYKDFIEGFKKRNIPVIDYCAYFRQLKPTSPYPLFTKTGFHWSTYGASIAQDTLVHYIEKTTPRPIPKYTPLDVEFSDTARGADADFEGPLNLLFSLGQAQYVYPRHQFIESSKTNYRPKAIIIGDSYFWQIKDQNALKYILSDDSKYWYYFSTTSFPINEAPGIPLKDLDIIGELNSSNYVILISNISNFETFPFGVADYYLNNSSNTMVDEIAKSIPLLPSLMEKLTKEAQSKQQETGSLIRIEAQHKWDERITFNLQSSFNRKFVCADENINNTLVVNRDNVGLWETFSMVKLDQEHVLLYSHANKFISTELNNKCEMTATRLNAGSWELFKLIKLSNDIIALQATNGKYVSVDEKSSQLFANSSSINQKEKFKLIIVK
ncbi:MAG: hypothetical protein HY062_04370 [Bacteroidetes bacterium]|nr:hypothetical protein [Bacteroidota bacterium]